MKSHRITAAVLIFTGVFTSIFSQTITLNEVMADPAGADYYDEFVELYNESDSMVSLSGWYLKINDYTDSLSFATDYGNTLPAHGFAVIMDRGYLVDNKSSTYEDLIPDSALLVTIQDNSLARSGLTNSAASQIYLLNARGDTVSGVLTTAKPLSGYSWEKIIPEGNNQIANWGNSRNLRGTPGFRNSLSPRNYDVAVSGLKRISPTGTVQPDEPVEFEFIVKNDGLRAADVVQILFGLDREADLQIDEVFMDVTESFQPGDSVVKNVTVPGFASGSHDLRAQAIFVADELTENNVDSLPVDVPYPANCLVINEFMYYPATDGGGEWVELFNISDDTLNLKNWKIRDNNAEARLTDGNLYLPPQEYLVLVNDSTTFKNYWGKAVRLLDCQEAVPALNNTKDSIVIRDHCRTRIDALEYASAWGYYQGVSLERKNPFASANQAGNWSLSNDAEKATPGRENSVVLCDFDLAVDSIKVVQTDKPIVYNSPVSLAIYIRNNGTESTGAFALAVAINNPAFGLIADTLITALPGLLAGDTQMAGITFAAIPGGLHAISAAITWAADENLKNNSTVGELAVGYPPEVLVINEIMFAPPAGQGEWFEIFNNSDIAIDLNGWSFHDALGKPIVLADSFSVLNAGEFSVIAARVDFRLDYPAFQGMLLVPDSFPTLNNASDSLFVSDAIGRVIDSVYYHESWSGGTGVSLERLDPDRPALASNNWSGSLQTATPGKVNSVLKLDNDLSVESFQFTDTLAAPGLSAGFMIAISNEGRNPAGSFQVNVYADRNRDDSGRADELCWSSPIFTILDPDSGIHIFGEICAEKPGQSQYLTEIDWGADEDLSDNCSGATLVVAFPAGCLILNEFLAYPLVNQVEFAECLNVSDLPLDLSGWSLGNRNSQTNLPAVEIPAGDYVVFSGDSAYFNYYKNTNAVVVIPSRWPGLNNSADQIWLKDLTGRTIDSLYYGIDWPLKAGCSAEKILPGLSGSEAGSWAYSVNADRQTAGYLNSVTRPGYDLSLDSLNLSAVTGDSSTVFKACYFVSNKGQSQAVDAILRVGLTTNSISEIVTDISLNSVETQKADSGIFNLGPLTSGRYALIVKIIWGADQVPDNDSVSQTLQIAWPPETLLLSEFMPYPQDVLTTTSSIAEYIEIYNPGRFVLDLTDWQISDQNTAMRREIPDGFAIPANEYLVISGDSSVMNFPDLLPEQTLVADDFPSLNNAEDALYLYDPTGRVIDSLIYNSAWDIVQGIALERISFANSNRATNWRTCVDPTGGTPGRKNSVAISTPLVKNGIKTTSEVFSPNGDGFNDEIGIRYRLPFPSAKLTLEVYDLTGRLIFRPARNLATSAEGVIYWNGDSDFDAKARVGIYIVRCIANDFGSSKSVEYITTLVLAR